MKVTIQNFDVNMEVKNKGIEFEVREPDGTHIGDVVLTKSGLVWCKGRTDPKINWKQFIAWMEDE